MLHDFSQHSTERVHDIGHALLAAVEPIIVEWEEISRRLQPDADETRRRQLRDALPELLTAFGKGLTELAPGEGKTSHYAFEHGLQRWELGWSVTELLRDFMILRRCVLGRLGQDVNLTVAEAEAIAVAFDEATAQSVDMYAQQRESDLVEANENLKRSNHELRRFAHVVAHEIRSPLATIRMAASLLLKRAANDVSEELRMVEEAAHFMSDIVNDTLDYAKLGSPEEPRDEVNLNQVFEDALAQLAFNLEKEQAQVSAEPLPTISGHRNQLLQLFVNLLDNAIKFTDGPPRVRIQLHETEQHYRLSFEDNGIGIASEHFESIFRFLTRIRNEPDIPGTGVGLAICRRVVEQHGGRIWVESQPGAGSTFHVELPKTPPVEKTDEQID